MKTVGKLLLTIYGMALLAVNPVAAQNNVDDQADVWATVEGQWDADEKGDDDWVDEMLVDKFSGWGKGSPAPRTKSSTSRVTSNAWSPV